ncbi:hypothetical protein C6P46_004494 [Rhodotorula mucilaginosa]|uniref:Uncharacterized protein n=1 Tax=Rhodotorula mucilaginosa TaxID=5537 RepID=A0A9P6W2K0_RHOMI|nr:hypothetical protein C6P46_004494 [Rhodotorula mucilaginosa]TKA51972.1 hypothetical protein B0A53_05056 [Rhodotorula sp. CCFEE 5036]
MGVICGRSKCNQFYVPHAQHPRSWPEDFVQLLDPSKLPPRRYPPLPDDPPTPFQAVPSHSFVAHTVFRLDDVEELIPAIPAAPQTLAAPPIAGPSHVKNNSAYPAGLAHNPAASSSSFGRVAVAVPLGGPALPYEHAGARSSGSLQHPPPLEAVPSPSTSASDVGRAPVAAAPSDSDAEEEEDDDLLSADEMDSYNRKAKTRRKLAKYGGPPLPAEWSHRQWEWEIQKKEYETNPKTRRAFYNSHIKLILRHLRLVAAATGAPMIFKSALLERPHDPWLRTDTPAAGPPGLDPPHLSYGPSGQARVAFTSYSSIQPSNSTIMSRDMGGKVVATTTVEAYLADTEQGFGALVRQARKKAIEQDARVRAAAQMASEAEAELRETRNEMRRQEERHRKEMEVREAQVAQLREKLEWEKRQRAAP